MWAWHLWVLNFGGTFQLDTWASCSDEDGFQSRVFWNSSSPDHRKIPEVFRSLRWLHMQQFDVTSEGASRQRSLNSCPLKISVRVTGLCSTRLSPGTHDDFIPSHASPYWQDRWMSWWEDEVVKISLNWTSVTDLHRSATTWTFLILIFQTQTTCPNRPVHAGTFPWKFLIRGGPNHKSHDLWIVCTCGPVTTET